MKAPTGDELRVGMRVMFGRTNGEQTLGEIVKLNVKTAKVKQLESRGVNKSHAVGTIWKVPFSLLVPATNESGQNPASVPTHNPNKTAAQHPQIQKGPKFMVGLHYHPGVAVKRVKRK